MVTGTSGTCLEMWYSTVQTIATAQDTQRFFHGSRHPPDIPAQVMVTLLHLHFTCKHNWCAALTFLLHGSWQKNYLYMMPLFLVHYTCSQSFVESSLHTLALSLQTKIIFLTTYQWSAIFLQNASNCFSEHASIFTNHTSKLQTLIVWHIYCNLFHLTLSFTTWLLNYNVWMNQFIAMQWTCNYKIMSVVASYTQALDGWGLSMGLA